MKTQKKKVLIYGFSGFGFIKKNPSAVVVRRLKQKFHTKAHLTAVVLPVSYKKAQQKLKQILLRSDYDLIVGFGVAPRAKGFRLERMAYNIIHSAVPDVTGKVVQKKRIMPGGKKALKTGLKVYSLRERLKEVNVPATVSNNPGGYLCNYAYYLSSFWSHKKAKSAKVGFVHFPLDKAFVQAKKINCSYLPMSMIIKGTTHVLSNALKSV